MRENHRFKFDSFWYRTTFWREKKTRQVQPNHKLTNTRVCMYRFGGLRSRVQLIRWSVRQSGPPFLSHYTLRYFRLRTFHVHVHFHVYVDRCECVCVRLYACLLFMTPVTRYRQSNSDCVPTLFVLIINATTTTTTLERR